MTITNLAVDCDYIKLYIRAVAHGAQNAPLIGEDIAKMNDFLSQLSMEVYQGTKLIYSGSPDTLDGFANNVYLGQFRKNQGTQLTVNLQVPSSLGNEYANMAGEVDWVFTVESYNEAGKLIQTGQMNWPVPVLLGLGVLALAAGLFMVSRKRKDNA
ncbi:MAG: LPXTG cell wall anchor domain-containing protein [Oscillospiraceae bacterium]